MHIYMRANEHGIHLFKPHAFHIHFPYHHYVLYRKFSIHRKKDGEREREYAWHSISLELCALAANIGNSKLGRLSHLWFKSLILSASLICLYQLKRTFASLHTSSCTTHVQVHIICLFASVEPNLYIHTYAFAVCLCDKLRV